MTEPTDRSHRSPVKLFAKAGAGLLLAGVLAVAGYYLYSHLKGNFHAVVEGQVYRSAQPTPAQLAAWHERYGIKTIVNLRGDQEDRQFAAEFETARRLGIELRSVPLLAAGQPRKMTLQELLQILETAPRPVLLHCLAGIDRTGAASVIAQMAVGGQPYSTAIEQLSIKYLHFSSNPDHLAAIFPRYEAWCKASGRATAGYAQFKEWVTDVYSPHYYKVCIAAPAELTLAPGQQVLTEVEIQNCSGSILPAAAPGKTFTLAVFTGSSIGQQPDAEFGPRTLLPKRNLAPGESIKVTQPLTAPSTPGTYLIHHDLIEENRTWFARQGSPVPTCRLTVQ